MIHARVPILGLAAPSGTGKTTLLRQVIALLKAGGLRVGVAKQARDDFDVDDPDKDSFQLRKAGIERLMVTSSRKSALILEHPEGGDPQLQALLALFDQNALDLILVEGFANEAFPKIELLRGGGEPRYYPDNPYIIALASDRPAGLRASVPVLDLNDPAAVAGFVTAYAGLQNSP